MTISIKAVTGLLMGGLLISTLSFPAHAIDGAVIASNGNTRGATACSTCHGANGQGTGTGGSPRLAGLNAAYLDRQLQDFASAKRRNPIMVPIAKALSADDMTAVAKYYAGLPPPRIVLKIAVKPDPVGRAIAVRGLWDKGVPGCDQCHGPGGMGVGAAFPSLAGQSSAYIANQLHRWQQGRRPPGPLGLMPAVAKKLSDREIDVVSNYFASLVDAKVAVDGAPPDDAAARAATTGQAGKAAITASRVGGKKLAFTPPPLSDRPTGAYGDMVKLGYDIFIHTPRYARQYVGNTLSCGNCHLDAGRLADSAPLWAAYVSYPAYRSKNERVNTYADRLQGCFVYSMNGKAPPLGSKTLVALESYSYWMAQGLPTGARIKGRGYPDLPKPAQAPDYARGKLVYEQHCALCHQANGQGLTVAGRTQFPALWGAESFNWGAGMHDLRNASGFIKANMPLGLGGSLSNQQAWDVAMYVDSHERPQDPRFTGSVAETRKRFHDSPTSMYGRVVNGHVLGQGAVAPGGSTRSD